MKKVLALTLAFSMCAVPFTAGAEEAVTAESLMTAMQEYSQKAGSMTVPMTMNLDAALKMASEDAPETSIGFTMNGGFDMKEIVDPMQVAMSGSFKLAMMGESQEMSMDMYMKASEDGSTIDTYARSTEDGEDTGWQHTTMDMSEFLSQLGVSSLADLSSMSFEDLLGSDVALDWNVEETDDSYILSAKLAFSDLMPLINTAMESSGQTVGEEEMAIVESLLGSFVMNMSYDLDKETKAAKTCHIDFNDSDLTALNEMISAMMGASEDASAQMAIALNDFSMDMTFTYDDVTEITIPEEALNAETVDVNELAEEVAESVE